VPEGKITEKGLRQNIRIALLYIESWLRGVGAVAIDNLMEDAATAEISRAQLWQWIHSPLGLMENKRKITLEVYQQIAFEELELIRMQWGDDLFSNAKFTESKHLLDHLVSKELFVDFFTIPAYGKLV
jgi:malate synthase